MYPTSEIWTDPRIQELIAQASNLEHLDASYYRKKSDFGLELSSIVGSPKI